MTYRRRRFLIEELARDCLGVALEETRQSRPFEIVAVCLLQIEDWPWSSFHRYTKEGFYQGYDWTMAREEMAEIGANEWE